MSTNSKDRGFTLLEMMIAVMIFGFLMLAISSFLHMEIHMFNNAVAHDEGNEKARTAMMHVLDAIRLKPSLDADKALTYYNNGVYYYDTNTNPPGNFKKYIIDVTNSPDNYTLIYYEPNYKDGKGALWYRDLSVNPLNPPKYLITDDVTNFRISPYIVDPLNNTEDDHLIKIDLIIQDQNSQPYELVTYKRLY